MSTGVRALATQTVVITGSTQGLGFGYAREFLVRGLNVVVSGRDPQTVARAVEQLAAEGAAENGHLEILKYIVEKFSVVWGDGVENWEENGGEPPMCQRLAYHLPKAARNGHFDIVKYLIEKGAEIDDESASCAAEIVSSYHMSYRYRISTLSNIGISIDGYLKIVKLFEIVKFLEEEGLSRCEALAIYNKIEAGELKFPE
jgi:hypothetical protein